MTQTIQPTLLSKEAAVEVFEAATEAALLQVPDFSSVIDPKHFIQVMKAIAQDAHEQGMRLALVLTPECPKWITPEIFVQGVIAIMPIDPEIDQRGVIEEIQNLGAFADALQGQP